MAEQETAAGLTPPRTDTVVAATEAAVPPNRNAWRLTAALFFLYGFAVLVPWVSIQYPNELDTSWNLVIHRAFIQHEVFGRDIVYTAGPWGILYAGYDPATFPYVIGGWIVLATAALLPLWRIGRSSFSSPLPLLVGGIAVAGTMSLALRDIFFLTLPALLLVVHFLLREGRSRVSHALLVFAIAVSTAVKFSFAVASIATILAISIDELRRRRFPATAALFGVSVPLVWLVAQQPVGAIPDYLRTSAEVSSGYAAAMAMPASTPMLPVWLFFLCAAGVVALVVAATGRADRTGAGLMTAGLCAVFFVLAKAGYVRHDIHAVIPEVSVFIIAALTSFALPILGRSLSLARNSLLSVSFLVAAASCQLNVDPLWTYLLHGPRSPINAEGHLLSPGQLRADLRTNLSRIAEEHPIPHVNGTTDIYGNAQASLLASGNRYRPRPVFQSLVVYTSELAAMNAAHLQTSRAAETIFFDVSTIDARYPALSDSLSWPELLTRYGVEDMSGPTLRLHRLTTPRGWRVVPIRSETVTFGQRVSCPSIDDGPVWVTMQFHPTSLGPLISIFYKPPVLTFDVTTTAATMKRYRLIAPLTEGGFILSPRVSDWPIFASLQSSAWLQLTKPEEVREFTLTPLRGFESLSYQPRVTVSYYRLLIEPSAAPFPDSSAFRSLRKRIQRTQS